MTAAVFFADSTATGVTASPVPSGESLATGAQALPLAESGTDTLEAARTAGQMLTDTVGQTASQTVPLPSEALFSWSGYFQAIAFMILLLFVLWGALWAVRRYGKFRFLPAPGALPRDALRMEAQLPLGPRKGLMVVRFLDKRLLLGVTEQHITLLKEMGLHDDRERKDYPDFERLLQDDGFADGDTTEPAEKTEKHPPSSRK